MVKKFNKINCEGIFHIFFFTMKCEKNDQMEFLSKWLHHHRARFLLASVFVVMGEFGWSVPPRIGLAGISSIWWILIVEWVLWWEDFNWKPCLKLQKIGVPNRLSIRSGDIILMPIWHIYRRWDTPNRHRSRQDGPWAPWLWAVAGSPQRQFYYSQR